MRDLLELGFVILSEFFLFLFFCFVFWPSDVERKEGYIIMYYHSQSPVRKTLFGLMRVSIFICCSYYTIRKKIYTGDTEKKERVI